jgi:hypothetical protein
LRIKENIMNESVAEKLAAEAASKRRDSLERRPWRTPVLKNIGSVGSVLQGGGGKLSPSHLDPGDIRKPPGWG